MKRVLFFVYGVLSHLSFLAVFVCLAGLVASAVVPVAIDVPGARFSWPAVGADALLVALFGVQHSVMARPRFKAWLTRFVPSEIERSTYVLVSNAVVLLLMALWTPIGPDVWRVEHPIGRAALWTLFAAGWTLVPLASLLIHHFDLFGTRQVWLALRGVAYTPLPFRTPGLYKLVRHPLYVSWIVASGRRRR